MATGRMSNVSRRPPLSTRLRRPQRESRPVPTVLATLHQAKKEVRLESSSL